MVSDWIGKIGIVVAVTYPEGGRRGGEAEGREGEGGKVGKEEGRGGGGESAGESGREEERGGGTWGGERGELGRERGARRVGRIQETYLSSPCHSPPSGCFMIVAQEKIGWLKLFIFVQNKSVWTCIFPPLR